MPIARSAVVLLVASLATGCGVFAEANRLGVTASGGDGVRAHFVTCPGETITRLALMGNVGAGIRIETGDDEPGDDPEDDEIVLWSVAASPGSPETVFEVGATPPGFVQEVGLDGRPADHDGIGVFVGYRSPDGGLASVEISFDIDQLEPDRILTLDDYKDPATFRRDAEALCTE